MTRPNRTTANRRESKRMSARKRAQSPLQAPPGGARPGNFDGGVLLGASGLFGMGVVMSYSATAPLALADRQFADPRRREVLPILSRRENARRVDARGLPRVRRRIPVRPDRSGAAATPRDWRKC